MPARLAKSLLALNDGHRLDDARRRLLADWCRLVASRLHGTTPARDTRPGDPRPGDTRAVPAVAGPAPAAGPGGPAEIGVTAVERQAAESESAVAALATATAVPAGVFTATPHRGTDRDAPAARARRTADRPASPAEPLPAAVAALGLPPRVSQVLTGLLAGAAEKQIARELGLSPHTVHVYVKQLYKRLGVNSRGELLARFVTLDR